MNKVIIRLMEELYDAMQNKLKLIWPRADGWFPPEANITFEVARLGAHPQFDFLAYGECDIGSRQRADMVLACPTRQWVCHVESKLLNTDTCKNSGVVNDLQRVATSSASSGLDYFLHHVNSVKTAQDLVGWDKYGLFVGADVSWMYQWWLGAKGDPSACDLFLQRYPHGDNQRKNLLIEQLHSYWQKSIAWGVLPESPVEGQYWIAYALFSLSQCNA